MPSYFRAPLLSALIFVLPSCLTLPTPVPQTVLVRRIAYFGRTTPSESASFAGRYQASDCADSALNYSRFGEPGRALDNLLDPSERKPSTDSKPVGDASLKIAYFTDVSVELGWETYTALVNKHCAYASGKAFQ